MYFGMTYLQGDELRLLSLNNQVHTVIGDIFEYLAPDGVSHLPKAIPFKKEICKGQENCRSCIHTQVFVVVMPCDNHLGLDRDTSEGNIIRRLECMLNICISGKCTFFMILKH